MTRPVKYNDTCDEEHVKTFAKEVTETMIYKR